MSSAIVENETLAPTVPTTTVVETYHYHAPSSHSNSKKRKRVSRACVCCQRAHMSCDEGRPCKRCVERGMAHLCRDGQRKQRGRKRRGPRGARGAGDVDVDDDLARDEPDSKRPYFGSDDDGTTSPSDSEDDIEVVGDGSSFDEDSSSLSLNPPHRPLGADWNMDSDRSTLESSSECGMDHTSMILSDADLMLPLANAFDPVIAREALQSTFFDHVDYAALARESDRLFSVDAMMQHAPHCGYQLLDCTF